LELPTSIDALKKLLDRFIRHGYAQTYVRELAVRLMLYEDSTPALSRDISIEGVRLLSATFKDLKKCRVKLWSDGRLVRDVLPSLIRLPITSLTLLNPQSRAWELPASVLHNLLVQLPRLNVLTLAGVNVNDAENEIQTKDLKSIEIPALRLAEAKVLPTNPSILFSLFTDLHKLNYTPQSGSHAPSLLPITLKHLWLDPAQFTYPSVTKIFSLVARLPKLQDFGLSVNSSYSRVEWNALLGVLPSSLQSLHFRHAKHVTFGSLVHALQMRITEKDWLPWLQGLAFETQWAETEETSLLRLGCEARGIRVRWLAAFDPYDQEVLQQA
jgi:hypothetical protein